MSPSCPDSDCLGKGLALDRPWPGISGAQMTHPHLGRQPSRSGRAKACPRTQHCNNALCPGGCRTGLSARARPSGTHEVAKKTLTQGNVRLRSRPRLPCPAEGGRMILCAGCFAGESFGGRKFHRLCKSQRLHCLMCTLHCPHPLMSPGQNFAAFRKDEMFTRHYPPPLPCTKRYFRSRLP